MLGVLFTHTLPDDLLLIIEYSERYVGTPSRGLTRENCDLSISVYIFKTKCRNGFLSPLQGKYED